METTSPEARAIAAALEDLRTADRILMGVAGARGSLGDQRAWDAVTGALSWMRDWGRPGDAEPSSLAYTFAEARRLNEELLTAQLAIGRVGAQLGRPAQSVFELPLEPGDSGRIRTVDDDLAQIEGLRARIRPLFAELLARAPALAASVAPLAPLDPPARANDAHGGEPGLSSDRIDDQAPRTVVEPEIDDADGHAPELARELQRARLLAIDVVIAGVALVGHVIGLLASGGAGVVLASAVFVVPAAVYVLASGIGVLRGARDDGEAVLEGHAIVVGLAVAAFLAGRAVWALFGGSGAPGRHAPGVMTLLVIHALRLRAASTPSASHEHELVAGVVVSVAIELGVLVRLLAG